MENTAGELIKVYYMIDWRIEAYTYDEKGNRLTSVVETEGEEIREYTYYDNSDRLMTDGRFGYVWDANGNLTEKGDTYTIVGEELIFDSVAGEYWLYEYDLQNRLVKVWKSDAGMENSKLVAEYRYDTDNLRVRKDSVEEGITHFVYSLDGVVLYEENGGDYTEYVYVNGKHFAMVQGKVDGDGSEQETCYYAIDHLGSTVMMTDGEGNVVWQDELTPFGESSGEVGHKHYLAKFTGKDYDEEVALYYFNARWYDPGIGRFVSEDPIKDGVNWYVYAVNNPLIWIDPTGLQAVQEIIKEAPKDPTVWEAILGALTVAGKFIVWGLPLLCQGDSMTATIEKENGEVIHLPPGWRVGYQGIGDRVVIDPDGNIYDPEKLTVDEQGNIIQPTLPPNYKWKNGNIITPDGTIISSLDEAWKLYDSADNSKKYKVPNKGSAERKKLDKKLNRIKNVQGDKTIAGKINPAEADYLGEKWVGEGYKVIKIKNGEIWISKNGLKQYRKPTIKKSHYTKTGYQANYQSRETPIGKWENNAHIDVEY